MALKLAYVEVFKGAGRVQNSDSGRICSTVRPYFFFFPFYKTDSEVNVRLFSPPAQEFAVVGHEEVIIREKILCIQARSPW